MRKVWNKVIEYQKYLPALIFIGGILLRVICLGSIPGGYHRDEAYGAWNALSLFKDGIDSAGNSYPVYFEAWAHGQNALNSYLMFPLIALAGGHITPLVVRMPQVILSILTLVAVYALMKKMFSQTVANWALFLVAICPWHVMMSRWGLESNLAPGFLILGLCFFVLGFENKQFLLLSALCYGLSLYSYATIWPIVPIMVMLQTGYALLTKKLRWSPYLVSFFVILLALGMPLVLFLLVNMGYLPEMQLGCFSIYRMTSFRSNELAHSLSQVWENIKNLGYLLKNQDVGRPYDVIMPYGFFYDIGRVFIVIGVIVVCVRFAQKSLKKQFSYEFFLLIQLFGAAIVACLVTVNMTQINCLYIPLVLCEAVGVVSVCKLFRKCESYISAILILIFCVNLCGFQYKYYTEYKLLASAHFQEGADDAVRYAWEQAKEKGMDIGVNAGLKYPNVLLATETGAAEYLDTLVYSDALPAPASFSCEGITFYMGFDLESLQEDMIYVIYYTEVDHFKDYELTSYFDWYVAIPK